MSGNNWFPFDFRALQNGWWRRATDLVRSRTIDLKIAAYQEVPAGSLPNDDAELAHLAGFGRDIEAFMAIKSSIMEPWVLCSDNRYYDPDLCGIVLDTWSRLDEKRRKERERKAAQRSVMRAKVVGNSTNVQMDNPINYVQSHGTLPNVQQDNIIPSKPSLGTDTDVPSENDTHTEQDSKGHEDPVGSASPREGKTPWEDDNEFKDLWLQASNPGRTRSSKKQSWREWINALRHHRKGSLINRAYSEYKRKDPDFMRTGGPGLHLWLRNKLDEWVEKPTVAAQRSHDFWRTAVTIYNREGRWGEDLGPTPDKPGTNVPPPILVELGFSEPGGSYRKYSPNIEVGKNHAEV